MAEGVLFSLAGKLLGELASPPFKKAWERVQSIRKARKDLAKLRKTIQMIHAVLLDAENKQEGPESGAIKLWIQRVKEVLYDADDLFDEVATDALLEQQQPEEKENMLSKVLAPFSGICCAIISDDSIAMRVKDIRGRLYEIVEDMKLFKFIQSQCVNQASVFMEREQTTPFVDEKLVIGRENEKNEILKFLFDESNDIEQNVSVICIVGIGGLGKTTLAQLIYNDEEIQTKFKNKWWACISNIVGKKYVLERIARSMNKDLRANADPKEEISNSIRTGGCSYLLVLDDVWDKDLDIWIEIMSLLRSGAKGSKIVVTTRLHSVTKEFENYKAKIHILNGLAEDKSWELFKKRAFTKKQETDVQRWTDLGWEIMRKCSNVPLALKSISGLIRGMQTIQEWERIKKNELLRINLGDDSIMSTLKLSYDHLPSDMKNCFAYCSLFPEDHIFHRNDLISLWIAQGYVNPGGNETYEELGHSHFMELYKKSFFQEAKEDEYGEIRSCKMHDLMHDLAKEVAGDECLTLTTASNQFSKNPLHLYVCFETVDSGNIPTSLFDANRIRTCIFKPRVSQIELIPDGLLTKLKLLRSLDLSQGRFMNVPDSIGDLQHLRYLNLGWGEITSLPDSLTKLVNLVTLNIICVRIKELPADFRKLIKLRHFYNHQAWGELRQMPRGFEELTSLQHLDYFVVGERADSCSGIEVLDKLKLKGKLAIAFKPGVMDRDVDGQWKLPNNLQELRIIGYPGKRIPHWESGNSLESIEINGSLTIEHLPPFRCLPYLRVLLLENLEQLEYLEEEACGGHSTTFFPSLEILELKSLYRLKGWSERKLKAVATTMRTTTSEIIEEHNHLPFPLLSDLHIIDCQELKWMPLCPVLRALNVKGISEELTQQLLLASPYTSSLEHLKLMDINMLIKFSGQSFPSLKRLHIYECSKLELVEWDSLSKLRQLELRPRPASLAHSLQQLRERGRLQVRFPDANDYISALVW